MSCSHFKVTKKECKHKETKYCSICRVIVCKACGREWVYPSNYEPITVPYIRYYPLYNPPPLNPYLYPDTIIWYNTDDDASVGQLT